MQLNSHYMKVELDAEKNSIKQRILRERLLQKHKDRVYKKQMDWIEKDERVINRISKKEQSLFN